MTRHPIPTRIALAAAAALLGAAAQAQTAAVAPDAANAASTASAAPAAAPAKADDALKLDSIVVTGTSTRLSKMKQSVSVSTLDADQIEKTGATSAAELLRSIPGVRAESSGGEGNANITVRGVPISAGGARYVQLQEDGLPVLLFGNSRGTMTSGWAMTMNFDKSCTYDLPEITCAPAVGDKTIKGAMLLAEFSSGPGYVMDKPSEEDEERGLGKDRPLFIAGSQVEHNIVFFPSSAILAGTSKWPAAFFARGLWDYAASLQGTMDSYRRVKGLKELVVVRAPHPYEVWPAEEQKRVQDRLIAFAKGTIQGATAIEGGRPWRDMKELVATTSDIWEKSTHPTQAP